MALQVAIQMDPMETINVAADSTFVLALEAQARGHALFHYLPRDLALTDDKLTARARPLSVRCEAPYFQLGAPRSLDLAGVDVVLMRQDPPFDMAYITATHLLEHVSRQVLVVNDPVAVRNAPEKLFATHFVGLMPPTLISSDPETIADFRRRYGEIILKPIFGNGGAGVFHLKPDDDNLNALLEMFTRLSREPIIVQRYLPEIRQGDKRIIVLSGEPLGAVLRVPLESETRGNIHVGGQCVKAEITDRDREICAALAPLLRSDGLYFVGLDVIGSFLTEVNVTSPTGIQEVNELNRVCLEADVVDFVEQQAENLLR